MICWKVHTIEEDEAEDIVRDRVQVMMASTPERKTCMNSMSNWCEPQIQGCSSKAQILMGGPL